MSIKAVVGGNWGDEGKGKLIDYLSSKADIVVRFQGGNNAGHTVINSYGKFVLTLLPSGVFYPNVINVLGPGVALNIKHLIKELRSLTEKGVPQPKILISNRAQIVMPHHILFDQYEEERLGDKKFGSTLSGIAPFYSDKYYKVGIQVSSLFNRDELYSKLSKTIEMKNIILKHLYKKDIIDLDTIVDKLIDYGKLIQDYICDTTHFLNTAIKEDKNIILEGQLGALRDPDHGIYPYSTSSSPLAGFASIGAGIPPYSINSVLTVIKAYSSCVGEGPFVAELTDIDGDELRKRGGDTGEFGAKTGRPRKVGWFDLVATKYGCKLQGATELALTNLDVLSYLDEIPVCTAYELDGVFTDTFLNTELLYKSKPHYIKLKGWKCDISHIREFDKLPIEAKKYVKFIETNLQLPITSISVGSNRNATIDL